MASTHSHRKSEYERLLQQGHTALAQGQRRRAHDLWQRAAMLNPHDVAVWLALVQVVDQVADERVCWENILALQPYNAQAQAQLERLTFYPPLDSDTASAPVPRPRQTFRQTLARQRRSLGLRLLALMVGLLSLAGLLLWLLLR